MCAYLSFKHSLLRGLLEQFFNYCNAIIINKALFSTLFGVWKFIHNNRVHLKFYFIYLVQKQNGVLGVTGCVFYVINCTSVKALAENDSYILNNFSSISILLVWVCLKGLEIYWINNDLRCFKRVVSFKYVKLFFLM